MTETGSVAECRFVTDRSWRAVSQLTTQKRSLGGQ